MPEKIPIVFHDGSNYDYLFIIKELAEEFKKQFNCYILQFIDGTRFMASSLSNLANNLPEGLN